VKRIFGMALGASATLAAGVLITACVPPTNTPAAERATVSVATTDDWSPAEQRALNEQTFLTAVEIEYPSLVAQFGEDFVLEFGRTICAAIDDGLSMSDVALMALDNNVDVEMVGYVAGVAIYTFCPENSWWVG
jgi:hypothetical protein